MRRYTISLAACVLALGLAQTARAQSFQPPVRVYDPNKDRVNIYIPSKNTQGVETRIPGTTTRYTDPRTGATVSRYLGTDGRKYGTTSWTNPNTGQREKFYYRVHTPRPSGSPSNFR